MTTQIWYSKIWPEAAHLRNNNIQDDRLKPLDDILARFDAKMTLCDRTGTGDDCHYKFEFEGDEEKSDAFLNAMIFCSQEVATTNSEPISLDFQIDDPEAIAIQDQMKQNWMNGIEVEETFVLQQLRKAIDAFENGEFQCPFDQPDQPEP